MALTTHLTLKLDNVAVTGGVTQKGREGTIAVTSLEWSFDSEGTVGEVKFTAELDRETTPISAGLKSGADADALFDVYQVGASGTEAKTFTLHGTNGKVTSVNIWQLNVLDPNLTRYDTTIQYTMAFAHVEQTWLPTGATVTIP